MNTIKNSNHAIKVKTRQILFASVHPEGGFIAMPDNKTTTFRYTVVPGRGRSTDRKGFVAWPVNDSILK